MLCDRAFLGKVKNNALALRACFGVIRRTTPILGKDSTAMPRSTNLGFPAWCATRFEVKGFSVLGCLYAQGKSSYSPGMNEAVFSSARAKRPARPIRLLPEALRNQIAAGEVVERPASALKELVENSLDAGADDIAVSLEDGGQSLLLVRDNGKGIHPDEMELALTRHATSKVASFTDLLHVADYGFRGEALASIASVSDLILRSALHESGGPDAPHGSFQDAPSGAFIRVRHGEITDRGPCAMPPGTVVEVRELFANVPARLKFLKTPATELKRCKEHLLRLALSRPDAAFSLTVLGEGGKERELLRCDKGDDARLRLLHMLPAHVVEDLVPFQGERGGIRVSGLASLPQHAQARADRLLLYVNNRPVNNRSLLQAVREAYKGRLTSREYPQVLLFLEIDPGEVDVNVHPAKSEVRFRDERAVFSAVLAGLRPVLERLGAAPAHTIFDGAASDPAQSVFQGELPPLNATSHAQPGSFFDTPFFQSQDTVASYGGPAAAEAFDTTPREARPQGFWGRVDNPRLVDRPVADGRDFDESEVLTNTDGSFAGPPEHAALPQEPAAENAEHAAALFTSGLHRAARPVGASDSGSAYMPGGATAHAGNNPPLLPGGTAAGFPVEVEGFLCLGQVDDTYLILLRARSLFLVDQHAAHERVLLHRIEKQSESAASQLLALPMHLTLHPSESERLEEFFAELTRLGFALRRESGGVQVSGVSPLLGRSRGMAFLRDLLAGRTEGLDDIRHMMACRSAIKAGQSLTADEAAELVRQWLHTPDFRFCPHGRPTVLEFDPAALEKLFKRKVN